jgi:phospholipid transport system substrate-binding protein
MKTMTMAVWWRALVAALLLTAFSVQADDSGLSPADLVDKIAKNILQDLDSNRVAYRKDPKKIRDLVDKTMLPYFDTNYAAQLVLAKYWRTASEPQKKRFIDAFYRSMLQNYGEALLDFTPDRLKILPFQGKEGAETATVKSEVRRDNGSRVPVNYSLRKTADGWKAYDVTIEGISYVKSFRTDFGTEIQQKGLDSLIERLEKQAESGVVTKPSAKPSAAGAGAS